MRLYLDDDSASTLLTRLLRQAGHDVEIPTDSGISGAADPVHLTYTIKNSRICITETMTIIGFCTR
jgi:hypothetical protein